MQDYILIAVGFVSATIFILNLVHRAWLQKAVIREIEELSKDVSRYTSLSSTIYQRTPCVHCGRYPPPPLRDVNK
jgi:rRNA-processing protein FCF1